MRRPASYLWPPNGPRSGSGIPRSAPLLEANADRQTRSERREAIQVVLEYLLSRLDLVTLCVGTPTLNHGFVDLDMNSIVDGTGLGQRRCERAIGDLKDAGFMEVAQPRHRNDDGKYVGLRAIRCLTARFFEWLGLGPMLARERARASQALKKRLAKYGRSLKDVVKRSFNKLLSSSSQSRNCGLQPRRSAPPEVSRPWYYFYKQKIRDGLELEDARRLTNEAFGYPTNWSPGYGDPAGFVQ